MTRSHERLLKKLARREELTDMIESSMSQEERDALILERKEVELEYLHWGSV